jgi:hypothetical protein
MRVYFVKHGLNAYGNLPGRYAYGVKGYALTQVGQGLKRKRFSGTIYGDARSDNTPGANVDPHVLSETLPWFLSFCLIDARNKKRLVSGSNKILSETVRPGDVILFGGLLSTHIVFVDTVLCVSATPELPQQEGTLDVRAYHRVNADVYGLGTWRSFVKSRDYQLNLKDAESGGGHHRTKVRPHRQIVGRRRPASASKISRSALLKQFIGGKGFNFVPLAVHPEPVSRNKSLKRTPGLLTLRFKGASGVLSMPVNRLPASVGSDMLRLVLAAETLVLDPIIPTGLRLGAKRKGC